MKGMAKRNETAVVLEKLASAAFANGVAQAAETTQPEAGT
jgi:hypothetical protein